MGLGVGVGEDTGAGAGAVAAGAGSGAGSRSGATQQDRVSVRAARGAPKADYKRVKEASRRAIGGVDHPHGPTQLPHVSVGGGSLQLAGRQRHSLLN